MEDAVDFHAHWIPLELAEALRRRRTPPTVERTAAGDALVTWLGRRALRPLCDLDERRADMAQSCTAMQVLSLAGLFGIDCLPVAESLPLVRAFNDAAVALVRADPERFVALAALPLVDMDAACRELERALCLGVRGAILPADGFLSLAVAERFEPLFQVGSRFGAHFFIHPGPLQQQPCRDDRADRDQSWQRQIVLQTQARLSEVMVTLNLSDYLDPYAGVTVQVANLGGSIPFLMERMDVVGRSRSAPPPSASMRRCYVDTASFGARAIEMAAACFGAERLLFGSDCPIFAAGSTRTALLASRLDEQSKGRILAGNARDLFRRERSVLNDRSARTAPG